MDQSGIRSSELRDLRDQFGDDVGSEKGEGVEEGKSGEGDDGNYELEFMLL